MPPQIDEIFGPRLVERPLLTLIDTTRAPIVRQPRGVPRAVPGFALSTNLALRVAAELAQVVQQSPGD
jgi:hypothetical protein